MIKKRLYDDVNAEGARYALYHALLATLKLLAPIMPFVTESIYQGLFAETDGAESIHTATWPVAGAAWQNEEALAFGEALLEIATAVRRYKSENNLSLGADLQKLELATVDPGLARDLEAAGLDLAGLTRAQDIVVGSTLGSEGTELSSKGNQGIRLAVVP